MLLRSEVLSVQLPNDHGKVIDYFTYDGYLDHEDRLKIRQTRRNWEQNAVSGTFLGLLTYFVQPFPYRPPANCICPPSHSGAIPSPLPAFSRELSLQY
jgi:hypothetical protein